MKAIVFDQPGDADVLRYDDAPEPQPSADELLVRVHATAVNRADLMQRRGGYAPPPGASPILGLELAGEVVQPAGEWRVGDRVMAVVTGGGYAELATVPAGMAMRIPDRFSYQEAAAIPEAFLTAYLNLFTLGRLQPGEVALIHAGASGVGTAAIQLARAAGARAIVTPGSGGKLGRCRGVGGELAGNHTSEAFARRAHARLSPLARRRSWRYAASWAQSWRSTIPPSRSRIGCRQRPMGAARMWCSTSSARRTGIRTWPRWRWAAA